MHDRFVTASSADAKLRKLREAEIRAQKEKSIFAIVAGVVLLALIYVSNFSIHRRIV